MTLAYIDRTGLEERFGLDEIAQLLDDDRSGAESAGESAALTRACEDATAQIDGYLGARYTLPLSYVPALVVGWAADIARFRLWDEQAPEEVRRRFEDVLAQLRDLAKGLISLPPDAAGTPAASQGGMGGYSADRIFTMDTLKGF